MIEEPPSGSGIGTERALGHPRQRKRAADSLVFQTIKQAATFYETSPSVIQHARNELAPGCANGKIYDDEFGPWFREWIKGQKAALADQPLKAKEDWDLLILGERYREKKRDNDIADGKLVELDWAMSQIRAQALAAQSVFNALPARMAMDLAGLPPHEIETRLRLAIDEGMKKMGEEVKP